ncbi:unnamed protein product [Arctogadus glacialis]
MSGHAFQFQCIPRMPDTPRPADGAEEERTGRNQPQNPAAKTLSFSDLLSGGLGSWAWLWGPLFKASGCFRLNKRGSIQTLTFCLLHKSA